MPHQPKPPIGKCKLKHPDCPACFAARLTGGQENPPEVIDASGVGRFSLKADHSKLKFHLEVIIAQPILSAHFYIAPVGLNGDIVKDIQFVQKHGNCWIANGKWTLSDAQPLTPKLVAALLTGSIYVNVITQVLLSGAIRGQLVICKCKKKVKCLCSKCKRKKVCQVKRKCGYDRKKCNHDYDKRGYCQRKRSYNGHFQKKSWDGKDWNSGEDWDSDDEHDRKKFHGRGKCCDHDSYRKKCCNNGNHGYGYT